MWAEEFLQEARTCDYRLLLCTITTAWGGPRSGRVPLMKSRSGSDDTSCSPFTLGAKLVGQPIMKTLLLPPSEQVHHSPFPDFTHKYNYTCTLTHIPVHSKAHKADTYTSTHIHTYTPVHTDTYSNIYTHEHLQFMHTSATQRHTHSHAHTTHTHPPS
jgi:hypothetical protein